MISELLPNLQTKIFRIFLFQHRQKNFINSSDGNLLAFLLRTYKHLCRLARAVPIQPSAFRRHDVGISK